jgi:hypothetical protein
MWRDGRISQNKTDNEKPRIRISKKMGSRKKEKERIIKLAPQEKELKQLEKEYNQILNHQLTDHPNGTTYCYKYIT